MYCLKCGEENLENAVENSNFGEGSSTEKRGLIKRFYYDYKTMVVLSFLCGIAALLIVPLVFGILGVAFGFVVYYRGYKNYGIALMAFSFTTFVIGCTIDLFVTL